MDLEEVTRLIAGVRRAPVPHFAAKEDGIPGRAENALFFDAVPVGLSTGSAPRTMAPRNEMRRPQLRVEIIEIEVSGGDEDRDLDARIGQDLLGQRERQPIGVQPL